MIRIQMSNKGTERKCCWTLFVIWRACVPRMEELIEAGMDGALQAESVQACLVTSERLQLMLQRCDLLYAAAATEMNEAV